MENGGTPLFNLVFDVYAGVVERALFWHGNDAQEFYDCGFGESLRQLNSIQIMTFAYFLKERKTEELNELSDLIIENYL